MSHGYRGKVIRSGHNMRRIRSSGEDIETARPVSDTTCSARSSIHSLARLLLARRALGGHGQANGSMAR